MLALVHDAPAGAMLAVTNLADEPSAIDLGPQDAQEGDPIDVFADSAYPPAGAELPATSRSGRTDIDGSELRRHRRPSRILSSQH